MAYVSTDDEPERILTPDEVRAEIEDWKRRVADLYAQIVSWLPQGEGYEADTAREVPVNENMMRLTGVPPYRISLLEIRRGGKLLLRFWPDARWILFTRGRVRVFIGDRTASLLAKEADREGPEWKLYDWSDRKTGALPFTPNLLATLLGEAR